ncbi:uncharacterized protein LOC108471594 [Gossypium arboreum]|uniref:uncharacterized protein LOC108471594 n=1 Tax=Gossypium arboreum TaxID=29729 RepID=UPI000819674F|nr:uncharacterized protein LOC108471594 [Gossypium arboreum]
MFDLRIIRAPYHRLSTEARSDASYCYGYSSAAERCSANTERPWSGQSGNGIGRGRGAPRRGARQIEARQPTLVYAACRREDGDALDVITCMFFIHNLRYTALINVGSTHFYIACIVSETLGLMVESTASKVTVLSSLGQSVRVNKLFRDVHLEVQGTIFLADFMEISFREFDLILGIDWLVKHQVNLDCTAKWVILKTTKGDEVVVLRECRNYLSNVISTLRAEKLVRKDCEAFLAYIRVSDSKVSSVKDIRTVKDFLNVFLDELRGLPPN